MAKSVRVLIERGNAAAKEYSFNNSFNIGRDSDSCQVIIDDYRVSRIHVTVFQKDGHWWVQDAGSKNGTFINDHPVERLQLSSPMKITLGLDGPLLLLRPPELQQAASTASSPALSESRIIKHYFEGKDNARVGDFTRIIMSAYQKLEKKQKKKYTWVILACGLFAFFAISWATYSYIRLERYKRMEKQAENIFSELKGIKLELIKYDTKPAMNDKLKQLERRYEEFVQSMGFNDKKLDEKEQLILRITRLWGECEVTMPADYHDKVKQYIEQWKHTRRLTDAITRLQKNEYTPFIVQTFVENGLAPQFAYLALQESEFNISECGPATPYGFAKGMWQFIPETALRYGLHTGPLVALRRYDPLDERHDFKKSTLAAAQYIKTIYRTDAQASGLLVFASYNWGENRVIRLIRTLPENPTDRNFWRLLERYRQKIPHETYDYVFKIVSASVICEKPRLFGFDFDNPLQPYLLKYQK